MGSKMSKRTFLGAAAAAVGATIAGMTFGRDPAEAKETFEVVRTPEQWRKLLTPQQYAVLREEKTERAGSSPLDKNYRAGTYQCAGCALPVFSSKTKYDSGTGWPSFFAPIAGAVRTRTDRTLIFARTEVHCRRCGGHLGHVFDDGPRPTGKRYCMNGTALKFVAA